MILEANLQSFQFEVLIRVDAEQYKEVLTGNFFFGLLIQGNEAMIEIQIDAVVAIFTLLDMKSKSGSRSRFRIQILFVGRYLELAVIP